MVTKTVNKLLDRLLLDVGVLPIKGITATVRKKRSEESVFIKRMIVLSYDVNREAIEELARY